MEAAVERAADMVSTFEAEGIRIIRLGLQANEGPGGHGICGCISSLIWRRSAFIRFIRRRIDAELEKLHLNQPLKALNFEVNAPFRSQLKGNKKENLHWWKERFALTNLPQTVVNGGSQ